MRVNLGADPMRPRLWRWTTSDGMIELAYGHEPTAKEAVEKAEAAHFAWRDRKR